MTLSTDWELGEWVYHWSINEEWQRGRIVRIIYDADGWELELTHGYGSWLVDAELCYREVPVIPDTERTFAFVEAHDEVDLEC